MRQPAFNPSPGTARERIAYIDGGSRGNPGPAGYGVVIQDGAGNTLDTLSQFIGKATNNVAEYRALLAALEYVLDHHCTRLQVYCDSELIVRQMQGRYRVQSPDLKPLHAHARQLTSRLEQFSIRHLPREQNCLADRLANEAMDKVSQAARPNNSSRVAGLTFTAVCEAGRLRPLSAAAALEEGAEYEVRVWKRQ